MSVLSFLLGSSVIFIVFTNSYAQKSYTFFDGKDCIANCADYEKVCTLTTMAVRICDTGLTNCKCTPIAKSIGLIVNQLIDVYGTGQTGWKEIANTIQTMLTFFKPSLDFAVQPSDNKLTFTIRQ